MAVISLCLHPFRSPEMGTGRGDSDFRCGTDGALFTPTLPGSSADGVVMPVEGSEGDSNGEGAPAEAVDTETQEAAAEGLAPTCEGAGEESMLRAEMLEPESWLVRC